ncbi:hypothetical protein ACOSP7_002415 [Xanthoceras sorbifolium]
MALKCAVELRIADIIHSHGGPMTLSSIASCIHSTSPPTTDIIPNLKRIMRFLVRREIFTAHDHHSSTGSDDLETLYGLNHLSRLLLYNGDTSMAPFFLLFNSPCHLATWHSLSSHRGRDLWEFASENPEYKKLLNDGVANMTKMASKAIVSAERDSMASNRMIVEIVKSFPHIKAVNLDLPHVQHQCTMELTMLEVTCLIQSVPHADAAFLKSILHDWGDDDCVKILKKCRDAIPKKSGKEGGRGRSLNGGEYYTKQASLITKSSKFQLLQPLLRPIQS